MVDSLLLVGLRRVLCLLTGVLVLEVGCDAVGKVSVDQVADEGLQRGPALLLFGQGDLLLLLDGVVAMRDSPLVDGVKHLMRLNLQREKHLDDLLASFIGVHPQLGEVAARLPDLEVAVHNLIGELLGHRLQERDDASLDLVEVGLQIRL